MSVFCKGPNFFASGRIFFADLAENFCQEFELATLPGTNQIYLIYTKKR
jgi:hypothetical protein